MRSEEGLVMFAGEQESGEDDGPPAITIATLDELPERIGEVLGTSSWRSVDQTTLDVFARVTGDDQWIHTDPVRAAQGPFGGTIAHGYFTLALCAAFISESLTVSDASTAINYGLERVRFPAPVRVPARVRGHVTLASLEAVSGGAHVVLRTTVQTDGDTKPACVADVVVRFLR
jgi:acyl dehydratase